MFKIGIIGSENSHATAFSEIFNLSGKYDDIRVVAIWGEDPEASQKIADKCGVKIMRPEDMLPTVDAVMVTSRNGALHLGYAAPFIKAGKPAFVDKPIANCAAQADELMQLAAESGSPVLGGSSLKLVPDTLALKASADQMKADGTLIGGHVYAPVNMDNPYGGFYFYSSHLVEIALTIFGYDPVAATAVRTETGVSVILEYAGRAVSLSFTDGAYRYGATVIGEKEVVTRPIEMGNAYDLEVGHFVHMLRTGEVPQTPHDIVMPVRVLNAIEKSYQSGARCVIE